MNKCEKCGFLHYRTDPCRKPTKSEGGRAAEPAVPLRTKSTAARKPLCNVARLFSYDDESGHLFWRVDYGRAKAGSRAGTVKPSGYRAVQIDGEFYQEHRIIWVLMTAEEIPDDKQVDHINQKKSDNRWVNLRLATPAQQQINTGVQKNNRHGKGVSWRASNEKWRADIYVDGKSVCLGHFSTQLEAQEAYAAGAKKHYGEYVPQALPVDTNPESGYAKVEHRVAPEVLLVSSPAPATNSLPMSKANVPTLGIDVGIGGDANTVGDKDRQPKFDKKAWMREGKAPFDKKLWMRKYMKTYMQKYRERQRAKKEGGPGSVGSDKAKTSL